MASDKANGGGVVKAMVAQSVDGAKVAPAATTETPATEAVPK